MQLKIKEMTTNSSEGESFGDLVIEGKKWQSRNSIKQARFFFIERVAES